MLYWYFGLFFFFVLFPGTWATTRSSTSTGEPLATSRGWLTSTWPGIHSEGSPRAFSSTFLASFNACESWTIHNKNVTKDKHGTPSTVNPSIEMPNPSRSRPSFVPSHGSKLSGTIFNCGGPSSFFFLVTLTCKHILIREYEWADLAEYLESVVRSLCKRERMIIFNREGSTDMTCARSRRKETLPRNSAFLEGNASSRFSYSSYLGREGKKKMKIALIDRYKEM